MNEDTSFRILDSTPPAASTPVRFDLGERTILLSPADNVAVARQDLAKGSEVVCPWGSFKVRDAIPFGHKLAIRAIGAGSEVIKYSQVIGTAAMSIVPGDWVHTHNLRLTHDLDKAEFAVQIPPTPGLPIDLPRTFNGYVRPDGRVGTRNYIAVLATSNCSSHVCQRVEKAFCDYTDPAVDGVVALPHSDGCSHHEGPDTQQMERTIRGMVLNPNVAAVVLIGLGCEVNSLSRYLGKDNGLRTAKPVAGLEIQGSGGTLKTTSDAVQKVQEFIRVLSGTRRTEVPAGRLLLGLNCGGSDAFSGISANPALGYACDLLVAAGGTVVLAETPEIYGAEQTLTRRAVDIPTGQRLVYIIKRFQEYCGRFGATLDSNPAPGNRRGGITNIVEKSLGAVMKGGTTALAGVVDFAEPVTAKGLIVMDTPGYDPVSITGIAAGGCNLIAFTTGRGSAIGFPTVPVLKIASNSRIFQSMNDNMDVNAGEVVDAGCTIEKKGTEIYRRLLQVASGERTKSEILGVKEFVPWRIGPVI